ncbi:Hsp20/alpha crystallin family protein, partial [bacterium]|nr:Hsp20/alpha crystallin family protein [bacterium]
AIQHLQSAERLHRQFFVLGGVIATPHWEPPVDMVVNDREIGLVVALPGVSADKLEVTLDAQSICIAGERSFGARLGEGAILRMEIPYGRFSRRILLPYGAFKCNDMVLENGCLELTLDR